MLPELKQKTVAAIICAIFGAVIVGGKIMPLIRIADYLYRVELQLWPFCVSGGSLGNAAVSVNHRISLAIATTVILSIVTSIVGLVVEYMIGSAPGSMTDSRITALYTPALANGFLAILDPAFHRPFHECKSRFEG